MFTFLSGLMGIVTGVLPEAIGFLKRKQEHTQELQMMEMQFKFARADAEMRLQEAEMAGFAAQEVAIHQAVANQRTENWVDRINALVRPGVTIIFVLLFLLCVWSLIIQAARSGSVIDAFVIVMPVIDVYLAAILGYWFGNRGLRKKFGG